MTHRLGERHEAARFVEVVGGAGRAGDGAEVGIGPCLRFLAAFPSQLVAVPAIEGEGAAVTLIASAESVR
ncbi:hypothetical protein [Cupriavidus sp. SW-Y-13]|uniref:hypothetical protein n=1 Tax=Cupriavidus sp. SW-Y-13 TaxID=2653854 RepID=UPI001F38D0C6|nr:hypothetical protein [Cupriavidus sp. SW-Y-13]